MLHNLIDLETFIRKISEKFVFKSYLSCKIRPSEKNVSNSIITREVLSLSDLMYVENSEMYCKYFSKYTRNCKNLRF